MMRKKLNKKKYQMSLNMPLKIEDQKESTDKQESKIKKIEQQWNNVLIQEPESF